MADLANLEARIRRLEDVEAIKRLKAKYMRCLDNKLWHEMRECFTEDATVSYSDGRYCPQGVNEIMDFIEKGLGSDSVIGIHHGHHPEIEITSDTAAKAIWALYNYMIDRRENVGLRTGAVYHDEYVKINGEWKIKSTGYVRIFDETWNRRDTPSLKLGKTKEFALPED